MKNQIIIAIACLSIGLNIGLNQVCKQKDSMIRLLMKNSNIQVENVSSVPKNLPIVNIK